MFVEEGLVQRKQFLADNATWEDLADLKQQFPNRNLEDKVLLEKGAIDRLCHVRRPNPKFLG